MNTNVDRNVVAAINDEFGLGIDHAQMHACIEDMAQKLAGYDRLERLYGRLQPAPTVDRTFTRPTPDDNRLNAWTVKTSIKGGAEGPLAGKTLAVKDNIAVAGMPMVNGSRVLEGYVSQVDATVVTRLLAAGVQVVGKSTCECYCLSGGSHTSASGPVTNPRKAGFSAGGSSSGSAALVASGEVDLALGTDQGGSVRIPSAFCGIVGMKPTWGLVPYTGGMPIETTVDHIGPMSRSVRDNAVMLEVMAGPDGLDPRQQSSDITRDYAADLSLGVNGLRIGVLREGFGTPSSESDVDAAVRQAAETLRSLGATVEEISIPLHLDAVDCWAAIANEGALQQMMISNGFGWNAKGLYQPDLIQAQSAWRAHAATLAPTVKMTLMAGAYMQRVGHGVYYAMGQNLVRPLQAAYDGAFERFDALVMPTLPMKATPLPDAQAPWSTVFQRAWEMLTNTAPFDITGHPALQVPCAMRDGLPVGMMLVGRHHSERSLYRIGAAFERAIDWATA